MNLKLTALDRDQALAHEALCERVIVESSLAFRDESPQPGAARRLFDRYRERPELLVLAAEGGDIEGPCALFVSAPLEDPLHDGARPVIVALWVHPTLRHRGLARALVREAVRLLAQSGLPTLLARAEHNDDALISMAERWGFVRSWELMEH